ncbi:MAG: T9SS type A sorting domain-containing protein [Candidatus Marinimicrobia bacterium]|jgi:hypothetical protein|nr:T9SS type A sorting domain-containing protein [Candidatus Neomarinimicrobiota bacterium]MBT3617487.1 T9SS type A sorting domain-containing protein [Candidatus Neomarinimicrobiota bacterium]MBT3829427.1 T9SS type A sorting domain-containing protein [Candidatus Neomarinimicrobiota bacterium]MBT3996991.1 T9SS type A sorting domain-containing protein [Candidatus Neomarinimicrobiota bacterium]MBT4281117.1 T9SS type A sorting domain-containing protein [Candidatus Neomarinimicrobiota bacterium]
MNHPIKHTKILVSSIFLIVFLFGQTDAWQANGVAIRQGVHIEWQKTTCPGSVGSAIMIWSDTRNGNRDVFAQKVSFTGDVFWGTGGVPVTELPGRQEDPVAIEDNAGGAFIAWVDYRFDKEGDIYLQHINSDGNSVLDNLGIAICNVAGKQGSINMCTDSSGGVFITWQDGRNGLDEDIYGTHVDYNNNVGHPGIGVAIIEASGTQGPKSIEYAGDGDAFVVWSDARISAENLDIYAQRIHQDLSLQFDVGGLPIANTMELETRPKVTFMSGVKSCVVWQQGSGITEVVYQVVDTSGLVLSNEKPLTKDPASKAGPRVKRGTGGTVFASWEDYRFDSTDPTYFIQKISNDGSILWDSAGVPLDSIYNTQDGARFSGDENGGVVFVWERGTFPDKDIVAQHFDSFGNRILPDSGLAISNANGNQDSPIITSDEVVGQFVIFSDVSGGSIDLKTQLIDDMNTIGFSENGITVIEGLDGDINYVRAETMENGQVVLAWEDNRYGKVLFANYILEEGSDSTEPNGKQIGFASFHSDPLINEPVFTNSYGSFYTGIYDKSSGVALSRVNRLDMNLINQWDSTGIYLNNGSDQINLHLTPHISGVACVWSEIRNVWDYDIYFTVLGDDGNILEAENTIANESVNEFVELVFQLPDGDYMVLWQEGHWNAGVLKYIRLNSSGTPASGWVSSGKVLSHSGDASNLIGTMNHDSTEIILVWENRFSATKKDIYSQTIDLDGNTLFGEDPLILTEAINDQRSPSIALDENTAAFVSWADFRNGDAFSIYGQRIDVENRSLIDSNILICCDQDTFYRDNPDVIAFGDDSFFITWEDERGSAVDDPLLSGGLDIYGAKVVNGLVQNQIIIAAEYHDQKSPKIIPIGGIDSNAWFLYWQDYRSSGKADLVNLYGQVLLIDPNMNINSHTVPIEFRVGPAYPNPFNGIISIPIQTHSSAPIRISIYNVLGRQVYDAILIPNHPGEMTFNWTGEDIFGREVASGIYLYQIQSRDAVFKGKVSFLK